MQGDPNFRRILLKLSGESLMGPKDFGLHQKTINRICDEIKLILKNKIQICLVIGGGNIFRGISQAAENFERTSADYMGMLATVINAIAVQNILESKGVETRVLSAIPMSPICEAYNRKKALRHLEEGRVIIFAAGTGNPLFTTDTAATLRATEMNCDIMLKGTLVDGIYDSDPKTNPKAKKYKTLKCDEALKLGLNIMDTAAVTLARDHKIPVLVFSIMENNELLKVLNGEGHFTKLVP